MRLETFFEKFELFADAPNAVAKMRELVLDLAVRGRLFGQQDGRRPDELPIAWEWHPLGNLAEFINGDRSSNYPSKSFRVENGVPFINAGHLSNGDVALTDMEYITPEHFDRLGSGKVERGDVLYCLRGSLGKCAVVQSIETGAIASSLLIIRPTRQIMSRFVYLYMISPMGARMISRYDNGSAQPNLSATNVKKYVVPVPPLAEQERIVEKVDELMALCDRLEAQQQEREARRTELARASLARFAEAPTSANLDFLFHPSYAIAPADLRKAILSLAVQGKLVPQDLNDEPALTLLGQIAAHKAELSEQGKLRGSTSVVPMTEEEGEVELPPTWTWVRFGQILVSRDGERIPISKEERATRAKVYDYYGASGVIDKIDGYLFDKPLLLIGEDGANLISRSTPIAFMARGKYWVNNHAHVVDGISEDFLRYIELYINAINLEPYVTGSAQPKMNQAKMNSIPIALPPLAEQRRIVAKVGQLMALVDQLEAQLAASRAQAEKLLEALVAELTAQE